MNNLSFNEYYTPVIQVKKKKDYETIVYSLELLDRLPNYKTCASFLQIAAQHKFKN